MQIGNPRDETGFGSNRDTRTEPIRSEFQIRSAPLSSPIILLEPLRKNLLASASAASESDTPYRIEAHLRAGGLGSFSSEGQFSHCDTLIRGGSSIIRRGGMSALKLTRTPLRAERDRCLLKALTFNVAPAAASCCSQP